MSAQWKKFNGSEDQISEILNAKDGFMLEAGSYKDCLFKVEGSSLLIYDDNGFCFSHTYTPKDDLVEILQEIAPERYLIAQPHPHADMIIEWARTGRDVYAYNIEAKEWQLTHNPWWMPGYKYSFNVPTESVENVNPGNTSLPCNGDGK